NGRLLRSAGIGHVVELDWWQSAGEVPLPITLTPAQHFSSRRMVDRNRALWGGFLIAAGGRRILFAGDSGYGPHFREIGARPSPAQAGRETARAGARRYGCPGPGSRAALPPARRAASRPRRPRERTRKPRARGQPGCARRARAPGRRR